MLHNIGTCLYHNDYQKIRVLATYSQPLLLISQSNGARNDAVEKLHIQNFVSAGFRVKKKKLVRNYRGIESFFL